MRPGQSTGHGQGKSGTIYIELNIHFVLGYTTEACQIEGLGKLVFYCIKALSELTIFCIRIVCKLLRRPI